MRPFATAHISPLGAAGVAVAGVTSASFRMVGPIYGSEVGLSSVQIGYFLATVLLGGAFAQLPIGWLADRYDRRQALIGLSVASVIVCLLIVVWRDASLWFMLSSALFFGFATYPIFSISTAHTNDFITADNAVEVNASLMFIYGLGAIFSPFLTANLIGRWGAGALFASIGLAHLALVGFGYIRTRARPSQSERTRYIYMPRTSFTIGKLLGRAAKTPPPS